MSNTDVEAISTEFSLKKTTKNTYCYDEIGAIPRIGTFYIQKFALGEEPPQRIRVCVEAI